MSPIILLTMLNVPLPLDDTLATPESTLAVCGVRKMLLAAVIAPLEITTGVVLFRFAVPDAHLARNPFVGSMEMIRGPFAGGIVMMLTANKGKNIEPAPVIEICPVPPNRPSDNVLFANVAFFVYASTDPVFVVLGVVPTTIITELLLARFGSVNEAIVVDPVAV